QAGLGGARPSLGCCVVDFDNDTYPDLFITGVGEQHLFHNNGKSSFFHDKTNKGPVEYQKGGKPIFEEVTAQTGKDTGGGAGLDKLNTVCLGAAFVDLDQDGDLDLVVCQYAATPEQALAALKGQNGAPGAGVAVYLNVGESPAVGPTVDPPPLKPR